MSLATAEMIDACQQCDHTDQAWTERRRWDLRLPERYSRVVSAGAADGVPTKLRNTYATEVEIEVEDLMATRVIVELLGERCTTAEADLGVHIDELVYTLGRQHLAMSPPMTLLSTTLALSLALLRLGLSLVLLPRTGPIARWREMRVPRVLAELLEQSFELGLKFRDLGLELLVLGLELLVLGLELRNPRDLLVSLHIPV